MVLFVSPAGVPGVRDRGQHLRDGAGAGWEGHSHRPGVRRGAGAHLRFD